MHVLWFGTLDFLLTFGNKWLRNLGGEGARWRIRCVFGPISILPFGVHPNSRIGSWEYWSPFHPNIAFAVLSRPSRSANRANWTAPSASIFLTWSNFTKYYWPEAFLIVNISCKQLGLLYHSALLWQLRFGTALFGCTASRLAPSWYSTSSHSQQNIDQWHQSFTKEKKE